MQKFRERLSDGSRLRKSSSSKRTSKVSAALSSTEQATQAQADPLPALRLSSHQPDERLSDQRTETNELRLSKATLEKHEIESNIVYLQGQKADLTAVVNLATQVRGIRCRLSRRPIIGDQDWIIFVQFADNIEWIARIPQSLYKDHPQLDFGGSLFRQRYECMIATIEYVATHTTLPVPRVHRFDLSCDNILQRPYILMDCLPGKPFSSCLDSLDDGQIRGVVRQWAEYTMELAALQFPQIGSLREDNDTFVVKPLLPDCIIRNSVVNLDENRGPFRSVADYILAMSNIKKRTISSANSDSHTYGNFLRSSLLESLVPFFLVPEYLNGPFVLSHRTLDIHSILVDTSGRLTGILSWQNAAILPLQSHIRVPDSLNLEFMPPTETVGQRSRSRFSSKYRPHFEKAMCEAGAESDYNVAELIDRSLMFGLFERAILNAKDERFLPALWEHVFGNAEGAEEFRSAMKTGDWGVAMADRWGIEMETK